METKPEVEVDFLIPEEERVLALANLVPESAELYQSEIRRIPLMEPDQARELAQKVQAGRRATEEMKAGTRDAELSLKLAALERAGEAAKWQLVLYHLRFAAYLARRSMGGASSRKARGISTQLPNYKDSTLPLSDRIQAANIGLEKAAETYQPEFVDDEGVARPASFTSYSHYLIQRELVAALYGEYPHLTVEVIKKGGTFRRREEEMAQELGRVPTIDELTESLGWDEELEARMMKTGLWASRLTFKSMGPLKRKDTTSANSDRSSNLENRDFIERALKHINPRQRVVLTLRYGLLDQQEMTLEEVGEVLGITMERVRQIEERALSEVRKALLKEANLEGGPDSASRLRKQIWG